MSQFRTLPPHIIRRLTRGIQDELTPLAKERSLKIQQMPCPRCKSAMEPHIHPTHTFTEAEMLPRTMARCVECQCTVDPQTGLVLDTGDPRLVQDDDLPIIRPADD